MGTELSVNFLNQPYLIDDTGNDAEMVNVLNLNAWLPSMFIHAPRISQLAGLTCGMWEPRFRALLPRVSLPTDQLL